MKEETDFWLKWDRFFWFQIQNPRIVDILQFIFRQVFVEMGQGTEKRLWKEEVVIFL